jgi:hypothetical protein
MNKLRSQLDRKAVGVLGENAPAETLSRFQQQHLPASSAEVTRRS